MASKRKNMIVSQMGLSKFLQMYVRVVVMVIVILDSAESTLHIRFDQAPPTRSRFSSAVFHYSVTGLNGSNACHNGCFLYCELDGLPVSPCPLNKIVLKNLTVNREHKFVLNVKTHNGERNSSAYSWSVDTISPTATISSSQNYTSSEKVAIDVEFSEACTEMGGFKCMNSSNCDVFINGAAYVNATSLRVIEPGIKYSLDIILYWRFMYGRLFVSMENDVCADQAGNRFLRTNTSVLIIHFDRRPVQVDMWTSIPSYELMINGVPRTILATGKMEGRNIFLDFSIPTKNSTKEILNALHVNSGYLVPVDGRSKSNHRFAVTLKNTSTTEIIIVELKNHLLVGITGTQVSPAAPITFLFDSTRPGVGLSTNSPNITKNSNINVIVEFTKPVFGFKAFMVEVAGGRLTSFRKISGALYSLNIVDITQSVVSVIVPAGKVCDISGNQNLASNQLEVKYYTTPALSIAVQTFITAGTLATSLAASVVSLIPANLNAIDESVNIVVSNPSSNLLGLFGHLQSFVLSKWLLPNQPIQYSETIEGLRWFILHIKLPWKTDSTQLCPNCNYLFEERLTRSSHSIGLLAHKMNHENNHPNSSSSYMQHDIPLPVQADPRLAWLNGLKNTSTKTALYGQALDLNEYFTYFLRGGPLSTRNLAKRKENNNGWQDLEMNLFWIGITGCTLVGLHLLILLLLRWRTGKPAHGVLSVPRFELFLLILMLPGISQSSTSAIRGGTTGGIIIGSLLLAIPAAFILSLCLFLIFAIFSHGFVQYKEVNRVRIEETRYMKLIFFFTGRPIMGEWFCKDVLPSSFLPRFGILFDSWKGPPKYVINIDQDEAAAIPKWSESCPSGVGRLRSENSSGETRMLKSRRVLGCAQSFYIIVDLLRRVSLGIISGAYSSPKLIQSILALIITLVQLIYLFTLKPYISRGVHAVECISLMSEAGIFGLAIGLNGTNLAEAKSTGYAMLTFLILTFVSQTINEWYMFIKSIFILSHPQEYSFKLGLKIAARVLFLPFLPRKQLRRMMNLTPMLPLNSEETELKRRIAVDTVSGMGATVIPVTSPSSTGLDAIRATRSAVTEKTSCLERTGEGRAGKVLELEPMSDLKKLREMAKASFSVVSQNKGASTSYS